MSNSRANGACNNRELDLSRSKATVVDRVLDRGVGVESTYSEETVGLLSMSE